MQILFYYSFHFVLIIVSNISLYLIMMYVCFIIVTRIVVISKKDREDDNLACQWERFAIIKR